MHPELQGNVFETNVKSENVLNKHEQKHIYKKNLTLPIFNNEILKIAIFIRSNSSKCNKEKTHKIPFQNMKFLSQKELGMNYHRYILPKHLVPINQLL